MVKEAVFAVPGDLATPTGGYAYDRRIIAELPAHGWRAQVLNLGAGFPCPAPDLRAAAGARLAASAPGLPIVIDGLAFGALPEAAAALGASHSLVALVHHPLALETGLSPADAASLRASERSALACARHVIATSAMTAALAKLKHLPWRLVIAGDCGRSPETFRRLATDIADLGLADRVSLLGAVGPEELASLYAGADLFVLPSRFEGYGMAYTEAIAHGVPVVGTTAGAIAETVPGDAGVLLPPDDVGMLAAALRRLMESPEQRERLAAGARAARFPTWSEQAARFARVLDTLA